MIFVFCSLIFVATSDQICMRTRAKCGQKWQKVYDSGTNCPLMITANVNGQLHHAYISPGGNRPGQNFVGCKKFSQGNHGSCQEWGAPVSHQRVHEHTDTCFGMGTGFGSIDLSCDIEIRFIDQDCDDAMWVDNFFIPGRNKRWGMENKHGWCMNGPRKGFSIFHIEDAHDPATFVKETCYVKVILHGNGANTKIMSSNLYAGNRLEPGSVRRSLALTPSTDENDDSFLQEIRLIEELYDVLERYEHKDKTESNEQGLEIVTRMYELLDKYDDTYQEYMRKVTQDITDEHAEDEGDEATEDHRLSWEEPSGPSLGFESFSQAKLINHGTNGLAILGALSIVYGLGSVCFNYMKGGSDYINVSELA